MRFLSAFSILLFLLSILPSCKKAELVDRRVLETDAGAALIRQLVADCPHSQPTRKMCIVLGPEQAPPSEEFLNRFSEFKGRLLKHNQVTGTNVFGTFRVMEKTSGVMAGDLVLLLQIGEIQSAGGGYQAIGAWAYKDDMVRRRYTLTPEADGKFKIEQGEILEQKTGEK